jgi:hypothetical protein
MRRGLDVVMKVATIVSKGRHENTSNIHVAEEILVALGLQDMTTEERFRRIEALTQSKDQEA